jgi:hypothetical protein
MIIILYADDRDHSGNNKTTKTIEAEYVAIKPQFIRCIQGDKETVLYFGQDLHNNPRWRNIDTGEEWKEISVCQK